MGQEEVNGPPKKKLKQGQLSFCNPPSHTKKNGAKRKLCEEPDDSEIQSSKMVRRDRESTGASESKSTNSDSRVADTGPNEVNKNDDRVKELEDSNQSNEITESSEGSTDVRTPKTEIVPNNSVPLCIEHKKNNENTVKSPPKSVGSCINDETSPMTKKTNFKDSIESLSSPARPDMSSPESLSEENIQSGTDDGNKGNDNDDTAQNTSFKSNSDSDNDVEFTGTEVETKSPVTPNRKLTPKQLKRREESEKKRNEKQRMKEENEKRKSLLKEQKMKIKAEKEEERLREKEEKEKKRQAELRQKEEDKRLKDEEKRLKEEEKKKKDEEKRKKEEAKEEEKKKKEEAKLLEKRKESQARAAFVSFFVPKKDAGQEKENELTTSAETKFMPFQIKSDMRLAEICRSSVTDEHKKTLDEIGKGESFSYDLYIQDLRCGKHRAKSSEATWPLSALEEQHDCIIIESVGDGEELETLEDGKKTVKSRLLKAKLFQFHDNRRPPYWGTWRKKATNVGPRKPFGRDSAVFDYEVDSDSEWEDEEEGESLEGGDDADKEQSDDEDVGENGYLLDNTFVPHGYLSDEEAQEEDENISPEEQKIRMIALKEQFDEEMKQKPERLKPRLLGCVWISNETTEVSQGSLYQNLLSHRSIWDESLGPIDVISMAETESPSTTPVVQSKKIFPATLVEPLVKLVHGSQLPLSQLVKEFLKQLEKENTTQTITKNAVTRKIKDIGRRFYDSNGKQSWSVSAELCNEYSLKTVEESTPTPTPEVSEKPKNTLLDSYLKNHTPQQPKKRVSLITLPKGEPSGGSNASECFPKKTLLVKKRVSLITLSRTPENQRQAVHTDTPRPTANPFLEISPNNSSSKTENVNLLDSPKSEKSGKENEIVRTAAARPLLKEFSEVALSNNNIEAEQSDVTPEESKKDKTSPKLKESPQMSISSFFTKHPKQSKEKTDSPRQGKGKTEQIEIIEINSCDSATESPVKSNKVGTGDAIANKPEDK